MEPGNIRDLKLNFKDNNLTTLNKILTFPLDTTQLKYYKIINLDYENRCLELLNTKENILYKVQDKVLGSLLNRFLTIKYANKKNCYLYVYNNNYKELIRTYNYLYEKNKTYEIEKNYPSNIEIFTHNYESTTLRYYLDNKLVYTKTSQINVDSTYTNSSLYNDKVNFNKYVYYLRNNLIYGINELEAFTNFFNLTGICVINNNPLILNYLPYNIDSNFYKNKFSNYFSVIYFQAYNNLDEYNFSITKDNQYLNCEYKVLDINHNIIEVKGFKIPNSKSNNISILELENIVANLKYLESIYDERFITIIKQELTNFLNILKTNYPEKITEANFKKYSLEYEKTKNILERSLIK